MDEVLAGNVFRWVTLVLCLSSMVMAAIVVAVYINLYRSGHRSKLLAHILGIGYSYICLILFVAKIMVIRKDEPIDYVNFILLTPAFIAANVCLWIMLNRLEDSKKKPAELAKQVTEGTPPEIKC